MCSGRVELRHRRTRRRHEHVYAGASTGRARDRGSDDDRSPPPMRLMTSFPSSAARSAMASECRRSSAGWSTTSRRPRGGVEFGLDSALPDAAEQVLRSTAQALADRFDVEFEHLVSDATDTFEALAVAGYPLASRAEAPRGDGDRASPGSRPRRPGPRLFAAHVSLGARARRAGEATRPDPRSLRPSPQPSMTPR